MLIRMLLPVWKVSLFCCEDDEEEKRFRFSENQPKITHSKFLTILINDVNENKTTNYFVIVSKPESRSDDHC